MAAQPAPYYKGFNAPRMIATSGPAGYQLATVDANLASMHLIGRERGMPTGYDQVLDYTDLQYKYEGMSQQILSRTLSAALLNARGVPLIGAVAPLFPTQQNNFVITSEEVYEIPFQLMESHGVPVITGHRQTARSVSMQPFKRAAEIDLQTLSDPTFGPPALQKATGTLGSAALLTVTRSISTHLVWTPFRHMSRAFYKRPNMRECARQLHFESHLFALGNSDPAAFVNAIRNTPTAINGCDLIIVPAGMGARVQEISVETRPLPMYQIALDPKTQAFVELLYEGPPSLATFTGVDGRRIDVIENPAYYMLHDEPEHRAFQSLRSFPVLGELILQPSVPAGPLAGDPKALTVWVHNQTPESIQVAPLEHAEALKWAGIWNNENGTVNDDGSPGDIYNKMVREMEEDAGGREQLRANLAAYFGPYDANTGNGWDPKTGRDNNTFNPRETEGKPLMGMKNFRHFGPFITRIGAFPRYVENIEPRVLPNEFLERAADCIIEVGARKLGLNPAELRTAMDAWNAGVNVANEAGNGVTLKRDIQRLFDAYLPGQLNISVANLTVPAQTPAARAQYPRGNLLIQANESLDDYLKAYSVESLRAAAANIDTAASPYAAALVHVPALETTLRDYLTFAYHAQTQLAAAKTGDGRAAVQKGVDAVTDTLRAHTGRSTAAQVLAKVADELRKPEAQVAALAGKALLSARDTAQAQPLAGDALAFARLGAPASPIVTDASDTASLGRMDTLFARAGTSHVDAMDVDAPLPLGVDVRDGGRMPGYATMSRDRRTYLQAKHMDALTSLVFAGLCGLPNSWKSHAVLAQKLGIQLVRLNFARPFQRYRMLSIAACSGGGRTYKTAVGHTVVNTSMQGVQGYIQIVASFRMAILPIEPAFTALLPHVLCDGFIGGCNTQYVRTPEEFQMESPHKPAVVVMPVPVDETQYHFPVHALNGDIYPRDDAALRVPLFKHSGYWTVRALAPAHYFAHVRAAWDNWDYTNDSLIMSLAWHRGHAWAWDSVQARHIAQNGTGPRATTEKNVPHAAATWAGHGSKFDKTPPQFNFSSVY
jgi:hypothetical protein